MGCIPGLVNNVQGNWEGKHLPWLGCQLGCTGWVLLCAVQSGLAGALPTAMNVLGLFAVANVAGYLLWASRHRLPFWKAAMLLVLVSGIMVAAVMHVVNAAGLCSYWCP